MTLDQLRTNTGAYIAAISMGGTNEAATNAIMADIEQLLIDNAPECVKQLGVRLNDLLDADDWNNIEPLLLQIAAHCRVSDGQNTRARTGHYIWHSPSAFPGVLGSHGISINDAGCSAS